MAVPTRAEVEAMLAERLAADPGFRAELMADPRGVLSEVIGLPIPDLVTVELHEQRLDDVHLTIPPAEVLADEDLDLVAGGWSPSGHISTCGPSCGQG